MDDQSLERHARHLVLAEVGEAGVCAIAKGRVFVAGLGGLGSAAAYYLAAAGVGELHIADNDTVSRSNLQRQILYTTHDLTQQKVDCTATVLTALNPEITLIPLAVKLDHANLPKLIEKVDIVVDCLDRMDEKLMLHDTTLRAGKLLIHGSALGTIGQVLTILPGVSACLRCFFSAIDLSERRSCAAEGVFSPLCGTIGSLLASEVLKALLLLKHPDSNTTLSQTISHKTLHTLNSRTSRTSEKGGTTTEYYGDSLLTNQLLTLDLFKNRFHTLRAKPPCNFCKALTP